MEKWVLDLSGPSVSPCYSLKLTTNLLKELESVEDNPKIRFTKDNVVFLRRL
jgi:hypothetical protein